MNNNNLIFIFTKDKPDELYNSIKSISTIDIKKIIIDDSINEYNQVKNRKLALSLVNTFYFGENELNDILKSLSTYLVKYDKILRKIGLNEWNLGYARNCALLLSIINDAEKVLFMDDDITIPNAEIVESTFMFLEKHDFVGCDIQGMIDDSIVGHISNKLKIIDPFPRMLSGGYLGFNFHKIEHPFINIYNEDWIWQQMHPNMTRYFQPNSVYQNTYNPFENFDYKILFQEIGEIFVTGLYSLQEENKRLYLTSEIFWEHTIRDRFEYISDLYALAMIKKNYKLAEILGFIISNHNKYDCAFFLELNNNYFYADHQFKELLKLKTLQYE